MAALGKIRSKGVFLIIIIGLGLFGFIAGDMFRSCESTNRAESNKAAVVFGDKIDRQAYAEFADRYANARKMIYERMGRQANEEQLRDEAWTFYKQYKLVEHECAELGLTVTDQELADIMSKGENQALQPLMYMGFVDETRSKFNFQEYKKFMLEGKDGFKTIRTQNAAMAEQYMELYNMLLFYEQEVLKKQILMSKFESLAEACALPNPYESQFAYDAVNTESDVQLAYIDYNTIKDEEVQVNESELKEKYNQLKENFYIPNETRSVEVYTITKIPTDADRNNLNAKMQKIAEDLRTSENTDSVIRKNRAKSYGVYVSNKAFNSYPQLKARLDSIPVGGVAGPVVDMNSEGKQVFSVVKLLGKASKPDSIEFKGIVLVEGQNGNVAPGKKNTTADSIVNVLKNGGNFEELAKKFGQEAQTQWNTSYPYESYDGISTDNKNFLQLLDEMAEGEIRTFTPQDGSIQIIQVTNKKNITTKYDVAIVREELDCSDATKEEIETRFTKFLAENRTAAELSKKAAQFGVERREIAQLDTERNGIFDGQMVIPHSEKALNFAFSAKEGDISDIISCGQNNEILLAVALTGIHDKGIQTLDNPSVKNYITALVRRDKKAEKILASLKDVKSIEEAKAKNATVVDSEHVTLGNPIYNLPGSEPALNGAIAKTQANQFSSHPIVGDNAVYVFKVTEKRTLNLDEQKKKEIGSQVARRNQQYLQYFKFRDIQNNAEIEDNRNITPN